MCLCLDSCLDTICEASVFNLTVPYPPCVRAGKFGDPTSSLSLESLAIHSLQA